METITTSPASVSLPTVTVLVDVPDGAPTDTVMLFGGDEDYYGVPMQFDSLSPGARKYTADYEIPYPVNGDVSTELEFRVRVIRNGLLGPFSAPFTVSFVPPLVAPQIVNFTGTSPLPQPT